MPTPSPALSPLVRPWRVLRRGLPAVLALVALSHCAAAQPAPAQEPLATAGVPAAWTGVDRLAADAFQHGDVEGMTLLVFDRDDHKVFERSYGRFSADHRVAVASASKLVAATVILRVVAQGKLRLDSTTGEVLHWPEARGAITLRHLLSLTSGLAPNHRCINNPWITLAECVDRIRDDPAAVVAPPGTRFDYGSTHLHVAARMAEVATGKTWDALFDEQLRVPLGLPPEVTFYTLPVIGNGTRNPRIAGGLVASANEYAPLLAIAFHRGTYRGTQWAPAELFDAQAVAPYPNATIGFSPVTALGVDYRYGLGAWLECTTPASGCSTLSSPGAFGWTPWLDREAGYYAVLAMYRRGRGTGEDGVVAFSVRLAQALKPEIRRALGK